jgi:broad-specificity NMP kinase
VPRVLVTGTSGTGKSSALDHLAEVEPLLRATCTHEIASRPLEGVVAELVSIGADA